MTLLQSVAHQVLLSQYSGMATLHLQLEDFEPGMTIRVSLDNEEYVIELDDGEPDEAPEEIEEPKVATADAQRFAFGGRRGG